MSKEDTTKKKKSAEDDYDSYQELKIWHLVAGAALLSLILITVSNCARTIHNNPENRASHLDRTPPPTPVKYKAKKRGYQLKVGR